MSRAYCRATEALDLAGGRVRVVRLRDEEGGVEAVVAPGHGGGIVSLRVRHDGQWIETLYRALDFSATDGWDGRAPLLFPQVGRCYAPSTRPPSPVPDDTPCGWELDGLVLPMPGHGFARTSSWELVEAASEHDARATCLLRSSADTRAVYPFDFSMQVTHRLAGGELSSVYELTAGGNDRPMPFTIGNHISLRAPFTEAGDYGDVRVTTPCLCEHVLDEDNIISGEERCLDLGAGRALADGRLSNMVLGGYADEEPWVVMEDPHSFGMRISQRQTPARFAPEDVLFVFWGDRRLRYFCPEPWMGGPDALNTRKRVAELPPGEAFTWRMACRPVR